MTHKSALFGFITICLSSIGALVVIEVALRFLPVSTGLGFQPVSKDNPIFHGEPNKRFVFSRNNELDYDGAETSPLVAVIGDSYIEAVMVPYPETLHGRLATLSSQRGRVYSFAFSAAPLSQYLAWAEYAGDTFRMDAIRPGCNRGGTSFPRLNEFGHVAPIRCEGRVA